MATACVSDAGRHRVTTAPPAENSAPCEFEDAPRFMLDSLDGTLLVLPFSPPILREFHQTDFTLAMARLAPQLDKPLRPLLPPYLLLSWAPPLSEADSALLLDEYQQWCSQRPGTSPCISRSRHDGLYLDEEDRLLMALDSAVQSVWLGVDPVVQEFVDPATLKTAVLVSLSTFLGLLLLPEPISKGIALTLGIVMLAYLGADTAHQVVQAWRELREAVRQARSFAELNVAGERFGKVIGAQVTRLLILLVTASLGSSSNLILRGPGLPALARVSAVVQARTGLSLPALVQRARSLKLEQADFALALEPPALFMSSRGTRNARGASSPASDSSPTPPGTAQGPYRLQAVEPWRKPQLTPDGRILPYPGTRAPPDPIINLGRNRAGQTVTDGKNVIRFDKDGFVEFETKFETLIDKSHIGSGQRIGHYRAANQKLFRAIEADPKLAQELGLSAREVQALPTSTAPPARYTWHHHQDVGRMQLIDQHAHRLAKPHTGGMAIWGGQPKWKSSGNPTSGTNRAR